MGFLPKPCESLKGAPAWLGPTSRLLLRGLGAPPWYELVCRNSAPVAAWCCNRAACVKSCLEITQVDVRYARDAVAVLQQIMGWVKQIVRWLAMGVPLQPAAYVGNAQSACAGSAVVLVTLLGVVLTGGLYVKEALDRCRVWQEEHPPVMLHPPYAQLRHVLLLQAGCVGVSLFMLAAAWATII